MAKIPEHEIERLKQEISIERLVVASGIELKKHGHDLIGHCPFHDDKTPSLVISPAKNLWHCLGACQCGGSVIDWVMKRESISFRHAVELLLNDYYPKAEIKIESMASANEPTLAAKLVKQATIPKLPLAFDTGLSDQELLNNVIDYYHQTLKQSHVALDYLRVRGLENPEFIDYFKIGYADRSLAYRLPFKNRKTGLTLRTQLQRIGILRESGHEHFNGSLVMPILDANENVVEVYGRKVLQNLRVGTPKHLYLPGAHLGIFNHQCLSNNQEIILCESLIDALTFWCAGFKNVTTSYGIEGFTNEMLEAFKHNKIKRILIAYDRDDAGDAASEKLAKKLIAEGIDCFRLLFPKGMDANEYALQVKPANKSLSLVIRKAEWLGNGNIQQAIKVPKITTVGEISSIENNAIDDLVATLESENIAEDAKENESDTSSLAAAPEIPEPHVSPLPETAEDIAAEIKEQEIIVNFGDRRYRVRGLSKNLSYEQLKVNILCSKEDNFHVDTLELYSARHRAAFINQVAIELNVTEKVIKHDLGKLLLKLETLQDEQIRAKLKPQKLEIKITDPEKDAALELLKSKDLLARILQDFERSGIVGEETNKLVGYLACVSRKLDAPLAIIIQSSSAAGKSSLMEVILSLMPEEERIQYSAMTGQSLFYVGKSDLKHKILAIAEEEGAEQASYALKLLQSEGKLTIASTGKDAATGKLVTNEYHVEGPVMIFLTTTAVEVDDELLNRCIVLTVNESREQTKAIHHFQRQQQTLSGLLAIQDKQEIKTIHQNAQRLLQPLLVANPFADRLTFLDDRTRTRRDHMKYLTLIKSIALLHQYQRPIKTINHNGKPLKYIEVEKSDIEVANRLAHEVLGRSLDELPPQTRRLLNLVCDFVANECAQKVIKQSDYRFSRRQIREVTGWGNTQLKIHLRRLEDLEYLLVHRGKRGLQFYYELLYCGEGNSCKSFLMGLINPNDLDKKAAKGDKSNQKYNYDANRSGLNEEKSALGRGEVGVLSGGGRSAENSFEANSSKASSILLKEDAEIMHIEEFKKDAESYCYAAS